MSDYLFDQALVKTQLKDFFVNEKANINNFGSTVNQTFEAQVFANVIKWYRSKGWTVDIKNPIKNGQHVFTLKFSTRGAPINYSYALCRKEEESCQIRHGLRTQTKTYSSSNRKPANIVCDIVVMKDIDIDNFNTESSIPNDILISFGEVKHMSAYAELIASFIGLVHELKPDKLKKIRKAKKTTETNNISCFLYVSGILYKTAEGIIETIEKRKYDIDIYSFNKQMT